MEQEQYSKQIPLWSICIYGEVVATDMLEVIKKIYEAGIKPQTVDIKHMPMLMGAKEVLK